jgi:hypothetical protein
VAVAYVESPGEVLSYVRGGVRPEQSDQFAVGSGLRAVNPEDNPRQIAFSGLRWGEGSERYFALDDLYLDGEDSSDVRFEDGDAIRLRNGLLPQAYTLILQSIVGDKVVDFGSYPVPMAPGATHLVSPEWESLSDTVRVWVDEDGDGVYEDSLSVSNSTIGVSRDALSDVPSGYRLSQNYPNPFNPTTTISYVLPRSAEVALSVHDVLGREVQILTSGMRPAGTYEVAFDATGLPSGVYFYRLQAGDYVETKRMVVVK